LQAIVHIIQVFIAMNIRNIHWYLAVVNAKKCQVQVLDSISDRFGREQLDLMVSVMSIYCLLLNYKNIFHHDANLIMWTYILYK